MKNFLILIMVVLSILSCSHDSENNVLPDFEEDSLFISEAFPLLDFNRPVDLQYEGDYLYVVEQQGIIRVFNNDPTEENTGTFLDITSRVDDNGGEEGLLGLAFHPDFIQNGYFFINYTTSQSTTRVSRFTANNHQTEANPASEMVLLEFDQPYNNHNGGQLVFGPDGYLYIAVGDGGLGGDPLDHGQKTTSLLGSILRIDINNPDFGKNYGIPSDNPFAGNQSGQREEIFAYGLRNPWRMSFDYGTGQLWVGDVGESQNEEIDIVEVGINYGWNIMEGDNCFHSNCDQSGLTLPYFSYDHSNGDGSITGGYVYHGNIRSLVGRYIYADFTSGRIWSLETGSVSPNNTLLFDTSYKITTFGMDSEQELYFCSLDGKIYKISSK